jgi:hypothetical protein
MDFDVWIRNFIDDCTQVQNRDLNALHASGLIAASAAIDPDFLVASLDELRGNLEFNWRYGGAVIHGDDEAPPDRFFLENCGTVANLLSKLMMPRFHISYDTRVQQRMGQCTREPNEMQWMLHARSRHKHHLLRVDSRPLGHAYVLYLPPAGNGGGNYRYYLYQANQAEAFPMFDLGMWLNAGRSRIQGDPVEHVKNLKRLDGFIFTVTRDWMVDTFTPLDRTQVRIGGGGWYTDPSDQVRRRLPNGETPLGSRGHTFTLVAIDEHDFRAKLRRMYGAANVAFQPDRFPAVG